MATHCINIQTDKKISSASPFAMFAFMICYIVTNMLMKPDLLFLILLIIEFVLCQLFFQFSPRVVFLSFKFLIIKKYKSPTIVDTDHLVNPSEIKELDNVIDYKEYYNRG